MGRRSDHSKEELKELILNATIDIVDEQGVEAVSARNIVGRIGYTVGTLYNFFKNLDEILLYVNSDSLDKLTAAIVDSKTVRDLTNRYCLFVSDNTARWQLLFNYNFPKNMEVPSWYEEKLNKTFGLISRVVSSDYQNVDVNNVKTLFAGLHGIVSLNLNQTIHLLGSNDVQPIISDFLKTMEGRFYNAANDETSAVA